ncbi:phage tail protein [Pseudomonas sp. zfem002]|uniref:phage tail protein n=1 Tax=Pseudomonas sp. zfem002 TaxID=3078197 RepID=UPI00292A3904|nr:phage tail protein [Pseudomonas sp. zfem002]MDU9391516.1 phage tail protein [Pseudomonas sp. zfem002]
MTDQNSQFFAILTAVGEAKQANANALGVPWTFAQMGVGDANNTDPVPSRTQTRLINERRRAPLNQLTVDPKDSSIIIAEQVIPPDVGGWWIREIGLYDTAGDLVAVANCAPSYKPLLAQGTGKTQVVRLNLVVTSSANVQLKIDPAVVLATRDYVDNSILNVLPPNKTAGTYTQVKVNERGIVQQGFNPTTLAGYGITDAMPKGTGGLMTSPGFVRGKITDLDSTQFISVANLALDKPPAIPYGVGMHIKYPTGQYAIDLVGCITSDWYGARYVLGDGTPGEWRAFWHDGNFNPALKANLASPVFTGIPRVPSVASGTSTDQVANTKFVMDAIAGLVGSSPAALDTLNELAAALGNDPNFAATMTSALAGKAAKSTTLGGYGITDALRVGPPSNQRPALYSATMGGDEGSGVGGALEIREAQLVGTSNTSFAYAPRIMFHWGGITSGALGMNASGRPAWNGKNMLLSGDTELTGKADKASTLAGYGIVDAYTQAQTNVTVNNAITALRGGVGSGFDTLQKLALALGGDGNFAATVQNSLAGKAPRATTLDGYGIQNAYTKAEVSNLVANKLDLAGGELNGRLTIHDSNQTNTQAGLVLHNPASDTAWISATLTTNNSAVLLSHKGGSNTLYLRNHAAQYASLDAGQVLSNGYACHTEGTFLKPMAGTWINLGDSTVLPAGGTWVFHITFYNPTGGATGAQAGIAAGGTALTGHFHGFAWRVQ